MADPGQLFNYNGKNYKVSDIERHINQNLDREIGMLQNGEKYRQQIMNTLYGTSDEDPGILAGLRNGTLIDNNGRFGDLTNRYRNDTDPNKDFVGWVGTMLRHAIDNSEEYISPEEQARIDAENAKHDWDNGLGLSDDLAIALFGTSNPGENEYKYFRNMGANRLGYLKDAIAGLQLDNYRDLNDADKARYLQNIQDAIKALDDNNLTEDEYIRLNKLTNGIAWNRMFGETDSEEEARLEAEEAAQKAQQAEAQKKQEYDDAVAKLKASKQQFYNWLAANYPQNGMSVFDLGNRDIELPEDARFSQYTDNVVTKLINDYFQYIVNPNNDEESKATASLILRHHLNNAINAGRFSTKNDEGAHYIFTDNTNRAWTYNPDTNVFQSVWAPSIIAKQIYDEWLRTTSQSDYDDIYGDLFPTEPELPIPSGGSGMSIKKKKIPILKGQDGFVFPQGALDDIYDAIRWFDDNNKLIYNNRYRNIVNPTTGEITHEERDNTHATDNTNPGNKQYDPEYGGQQVEGQDFWNKWVDLLTNNEDLAKTFAEEYRYYAANNGDTGKKMPHADKWFNADNSFNFDEFRKSVNANGKALWNDQLNGIGHDFYKGQAYYIDDGNGAKKYYKEVPEGYHITETKDESNPLVTAVKLEQDGSEGESQDGAVKINDPYSSFIATELYKKYGLLDDKPKFDIPGLSGEIAKYGITRHGQNKSFRDILDHLSLDVHNPDWRQSAVRTGYEFQTAGEKALGEAMTLAKDVTSDSAANAARKFQAFNIGKQHQQQNQQQAYNVFTTTSQQAKKDQDYSSAQNNTTANQNIDRISAYNERLGQLWAAHHKARTETDEKAIDTAIDFLKQYRTDKKNYEYNTLKRNQALQYAGWDIAAKNAYRKGYNKIKEMYPNDDVFKLMSRTEMKDLQEGINSWLSNKVALLSSLDLRDPNSVDITVFQETPDLDDFYNNWMSGLKSPKSSTSRTTSARMGQKILLQKRKF